MSKNYFDGLEEQNYIPPGWRTSFCQCKLIQEININEKRTQVVWIPQEFAIKNKIIKIVTSQIQSEEWLIESVGDVTMSSKEMIDLYGSKPNMEEYLF